MNNFRKKWNGKIVKNDITAKSFVTAFKNMLKRELNPYGINVSLKSGFYYCSGFLEKNGKYIYISYNIPRYGESIDFNTSGILGVLYRTAKNNKDYTGGYNYFSSMYELPKNIKNLFDNYNCIRRKI